jgi:RNA polymerase sigma-70 factor (ECF subfamily)
MSTESNENYASLLQSGDENAFKAIFHKFYVPVCKAVHRIIRDKGIVEDLAQDIFVRLWERREQINITTTLGAYLHRMAVNEALTYIRRQKKFQTTDIAETDFKANDHNSIEVMAGKELKANISAAISQLPPRCQAIFKLSRYEQMTYKQIGEQLDISVKTVENQMGKALKILRGLLQNYLTWLVLCIYIFG